MNDSIAAVEKALAETGRQCLRLIGTRALKPEQYQALSKWMFSCMNQRYTIRKRVELRGRDELKKVMTFIARACEVLLEIDDDSAGP
jgi:hypothetical protein